MAPRHTTLSIAFVMACALPATAQTKLYGISLATDGIADLYEIDEATGATTAVMNVDVPPGFDPWMLSYHGPTDQFLVQLLAQGSTGSTITDWRLGVLDPATQSITAHAYHGWPGITNVEGLTYDPGTNQIIVTAATTVNSIFRLTVDLTGQILGGGSIPAPGITDRDYAGFDPSTGNLLLADFNGNGGTPVVLGIAISGVSSTVSNAPFATWAHELAVSPTGDIYTTEFDNLELVRITPTAYVTIGPFQAQKTIRGITFAPELFLIQAVASPFGPSCDFGTFGNPATVTYAALDAPAIGSVFQTQATGVPPTATAGYVLGGILQFAPPGYAPLQTVWPAVPWNCVLVHHVDLFSVPLAASDYSPGSPTATFSIDLTTATPSAAGFPVKLQMLFQDPTLPWASQIDVLTTNGISTVFGF